MRIFCKTCPTAGASTSNQENTISRSAARPQPLAQGEGRSILDLLQKVHVLWEPLSRCQAKTAGSEALLDHKKHEWIALSFTMVSLPSWLHRRPAFPHCYVAQPLYYRAPTLQATLPEEIKNRNVKTHSDNNFQLKLTRFLGKFWW